MKKKKDENQNPYHKDYGLFSNMRYIMSNMFRYVPKMRLYIPVGIICAPLMQYLWTFITKFVVDMITGEKGWESLLWLIAMVTMVQIISTMMNTWRGSKWSWFIYARMKMMVEFNRKIMTIDFKNTEDPDVMDCREKGGRAAQGNNMGLEGMMRQGVNLLEYFAVTAVGLIILGTMNIFVVLVLAVLSGIGFAAKKHANKRC